MRWGDGTLRWVRPLRALLCMFNGKVLSCAVDGIEAGSTTFGHRFMAPDALKIDKADDYLSKLEQAYVIADKAKREAVILEKAEGLATAEDLDLVDDAGLLAEVAGLVEWPVPLMGRIDDAFMDVPEEVLVSVMRTHQKYLALRDKSGQLAPRFITIANIETADNGAKIIAGNERVLRARLSDARFFWDEDRKTDVRVVSMDYTYMEDREDKVFMRTETVNEEEEGLSPEDLEFKKKGMPILIVHDREHKYVTCTVVPRKGPHPYAVRSLGRDIRDVLGYVRLVLKDDQEPAIL